MVHKRVAPFDRRVTALAWHPSLLDVVAVGSHGGAILQWDLSDASRNIFLQGVSGLRRVLHCFCVDEWFRSLLIYEVKYLAIVYIIPIYT